MRWSLPPIFLCLLFLLPASARAQSNPLAGCKNGLIEKETFTYPLVEGSDSVHEGRMSGHVKVICDNVMLQADEIHWREDSPMVYASGNVYFDDNGTQISAEKAEMNRDTHLGSFFQASGWLQLSTQKLDKSLFGTQEPYAIFWADRIEKIADKTYELTHGGFTTCRQPTPRWDMSSSKLVIVAGEHAMLRNMVLHVKDVPIFYLPAIYYPIKHEDRATGLLIPNYGASTLRGITLNNAFFWAINRSRDATFYYDYMSQAGQGVGSEYRYVGENGSQGNGRFYMLNQPEILAEDGTTVTQAGHRSFDLRGTVNQALNSVFRLTGNVNYFTDVQTNQLYQQNVYDMTQRTRSFGATISGGTGRYRVTGQYDQTDTFYGTQATRTGNSPIGNFSIGDKPIGHSLVYFGANATGGYFKRLDNIDDPLTDRSIWRIDGSPHVSVPVSNLPALTVTTSAAWRYTFWTQSVDPVANARVDVPISRQIVDLEAKVVGPVFSRIYRTPDNGYAEGFKHLIEPNLSISWLSPFSEGDKIVQLDGVDTIVGGTTTYQYGVTNRIMAKRRTGGPVGVVREVLTVDIHQSYYTNALAAQYDSQYSTSINGLNNIVLAAPSPFSPVRITATGRPSETTSAQFVEEYDTKFHAVRTYTASATIDEPAAEITAAWNKRNVIPGLVNFTNPSSASDFIQAHTTIRATDNSVGGMFSFNYDVGNGYFLQRRIRVFYNSQCCGVAFDFQSVNLSNFQTVGTLPPVDRRFTISFTLAGIGTFASPLGSFSNSGGSH